MVSYSPSKPTTKNPQRIKKSDKEHIEKLDYSGIKFPVTINQYNKIERQNSIGINVFGYEEREPFPIYISKENFKNQMSLLLITEEENKHYALIKYFNNFMHKQTKYNGRKHFSMYCLQCFTSEDILIRHKENCININGKQAIKMPEKNSKLKFENFHKQLSIPFVIYADFEAITKKIQGCRPNNDKSYTKAYQTHEDCGYGFQVVCCYDDRYTKPVQIYRGENAVHNFMEEMLLEHEYCKNIMRNNFSKELKMTNANEQNFKNADKCHICDRNYTDKDICVRDHCHITGKYRGSAHQECNLKLKIKPEHIKLPVIFHNLRGYDSHFIMRSVGKIANKPKYINKNGEERKMDINVIPNSMEKYLAVMLGNHLTFIDSFQFMSTSLNELVNNLLKKALSILQKKLKMVKC